MYVDVYNLKMSLNKLQLYYVWKITSVIYDYSQYNSIIIIQDLK